MSKSPAEIAAENVRGLMGRHQIRQTQIAVLLGISQAAVSKRVRGETPFSVEELTKVAGLFGVPVTDLLDGVAA